MLMDHLNNTLFNNFSMVFCTQCGEEIKEINRFCRACGTPVKPSTEKESSMSEISGNELEQISTQSEEKNNTDYETNITVSPKLESFDFSDSSIDRKTQFDDGMLVLTSRDLILYTSDEKDELKRIPITTIQSCSYSTIRRGLLIKRRINEEDNFQLLLTQKHAKFSDLKSKKMYHENELRETRVRLERQEIKEKIARVENEMGYLSQEIKQLESDPTKIKLVQEKVADIKKEVFKLPKNFESNSDKSVREEYKIWEYVVNRRKNGISKIKIETIPYDGIVTINEEVMGLTPLTIDKPLIDIAILEGKYKIQILKEGYDSEEFKLSTKLDKDSFLKKVQLSTRDKPDYKMDQRIEDLRKTVPDKSIDLSFYEKEREVEGRNEILLLTKDEILVMSKDKEQCLFEIPYGSINEAKYDKGFLRGSKAVKIDYNERHFRNLMFDFWIDDEEGKISSSELKQRSESLSEILNRKRKESKVIDIPNRIRAPNYFIVTESDIKNNFSRFEPFEFERLVAKLFEKKGYKATVTQESGDFGVDILAEAGKEKIAIQVKHWQASVGGPDVHKTLGSMITFGANRAMVITSSDFTNQAYEIQKRGSPVELWNGSRLRDEFRQYLLDAINEAKNSSN